MAEAAVKIEIREPAFIRRFEIADLSKHGPWLMKRFLAKFPEMGEKQIAGYLNGLIVNNEHIFLYQDHAVALAQIVFNPGIKRVVILQERFVWVENREDKQELSDAADFYDQFKLEAGRREAERIIVCEDSDVPKTLIEQRLGRVFDTKVSHVRV